MPSTITETVQYQAALSDVMFMAGSGALPVAALSNVRSTIANPANSGRILIIHQLDVFSTLSATFARLWINPTTGLPASSARPVLNCNVSGNNTPGVAVIKVDAVLQAVGAALGGGIDTGVDFALGPAMLGQFAMPPIIIRPGNALGIGAPISAAANLAMVIRWSEQPGT